MTVYEPSKGFRVFCTRVGHPDTFEAVRLTASQVDEYGKPLEEALDEVCDLFRRDGVRIRPDRRARIRVFVQQHMIIAPLIRARGIPYDVACEDWLLDEELVASLPPLPQPVRVKDHQERAALRRRMPAPGERLSAEQQAAYAREAIAKIKGR